MLVVIWILRLLVKAGTIKKGNPLFSLNRYLRVYHKNIGIAFFAISLLHGLLSSAELFSNNWGSITFWVIAAMSASYMIRKLVSRKLWANVHRLLTVSVVALLILHLLDVGISAPMLIENAFTSSQTQSQTTIQMEDLTTYVDEPQSNSGSNTDNTADSTTDVQSNVDITDYNDTAVDSTKTYNDGVYQGVASGFGPDLVVSVTIENDLITNVEVISHNEVGKRFYSTPMETIPGEIVSQQTPYVDSVSGATMSSVGIKNAVIDALADAVVNADNAPVQETPPQSSGRHH